MHTLNRAHGLAIQALRPVVAPEAQFSVALDLAVFRPSTGQWLIRQDDGTPITVQFVGGAGDQPVPADYMALGRAQIRRT